MAMNLAKNDKGILVGKQNVFTVGFTPSDYVIMDKYSGFGEDKIFPNRTEFIRASINWLFRMLFHYKREGLLKYKVVYDLDVRQFSDRATDEIPSINFNSKQIDAIKLIKFKDLIL